MIDETILYYTLYKISGWICFGTSVICSYWIGNYHRKLLQQYSQKKEAKYELDIQKETHIFWDNFDKLSNSNIHPDLYCYETFMNLQREPHPDEKKWKSRKIIQYTPQGNVVMFYDLYRQAFVYYSDMQIPYNWLNVCAMKYVRYFCCRDFFWGFRENIDKAENNVFLGFYTQEEEEKKKKQKEKKAEMNIDFQSDVFLQKREHLKENKKDDLHSTSIKESKYTNHFCYLGKWRDLQLCDSESYKKQNNIKKRSSYAEFKKKKHTM